MENDLIFKLWVESQRVKIREWRLLKSKKKFVGERGYLHFDGKIFFKYHIDSNNHQICDCLKNKNEIISHCFLPFIRDDQRVRRYRNKKTKDGLGNTRNHTDRFSTIKNRPIMYASHRDACIYSMYGFMINEKYEKEIERLKLNDNILAYRRIQKNKSNRNKSNIDFAKDIYDKVLKNDEVGLIMIDVSHFFDNINHKKLFEKWSKLLNLSLLPKDHAAVFKSITKYRYVFKKDIHEALGLTPKKLQILSNKKHGSLCSPHDYNNKIKKNKLIHQNKSDFGIPQGSPISGLLANLYMLSFDEQMRDFVETKFNGTYARYSDDIIVLIKKEKLKEAYDYAKFLIRRENLDIKDKKTDCFIFNKTKNRYVNSMNIIVDTNGNKNHKEYPQYLGFLFGSKEMLLRSSTLARRFRGKHRLDKNRWNYFQLAKNCTKSVSLGKQVISLRSKIKKMTNQINIPGKNAHIKK